MAPVTKSARSARGARGDPWLPPGEASGVGFAARGDGLAGAAAEARAAALELAFDVSRAAGGVAFVGDALGVLRALAVARGGVRFCAGRPFGAEAAAAGFSVGGAGSVRASAGGGVPPSWAGSVSGRSDR
ncbi:MAG: hypothetical protein AB7O67_07685 [Vicinamibacterales bacterium]